MLKLLTALLAGFIFAIGLGIAGMTQPLRVISFLDIFGDWNPALAFVMIGAIAVHSLSYLIARNKKSPALDANFYIPKKNTIDSKLISGSALFGVGWGLGGFCPGPAITSLASGSAVVFTFAASMALGMLFFKSLQIFGITK